jgi:hypothetical protein
MTRSRHNRAPEEGRAYICSCVQMLWCDGVPGFQCDGTALPGVRP